MQVIDSQTSARKPPREARPTLAELHDPTFRRKLLSSRYEHYFLASTHQISILAGAIGSAFGCYLGSAVSQILRFIAHRKVSGSSPL